MPTQLRVEDMIQQQGDHGGVALLGCEVQGRIPIQAVARYPAGINRQAVPFQKVDHLQGGQSKLTIPAPEGGGAFPQLDNVAFRNTNTHTLQESDSNKFTSPFTESQGISRRGREEEPAIGTDEETRRPAGGGGGGGLRKEGRGGNETPRAPAQVAGAQEGGCMHKLRR